MNAIKLVLAFGGLFSSFAGDSMQLIPKDIEVWRLDSLGKACSCWFTIEQFVTDTAFINLNFGFLGKSRIHGVMSVDSAIKELGKNKRLIAYRSNADSNVIHIVGKALVQWKENPLDKMVDSLKYEGKLPGLIQVLHKTTPKLDYKIGHIIGSRKRNDATSQVKVDVKGSVIREIITKPLPLKGYSKVLWIANTHLSSRNTEMDFQGPEFSSRKILEQKIKRALKVHEASQWRTE